MSQVDHSAQAKEIIERTTESLDRHVMHPTLERAPIDATLAVAHALLAVADRVDALAYLMNGGRQI